MNWGYRLMFVYLLFVGGMITMAVLSFRQPLDMENENYYEAEKEQDARMQQRESGKAFRPLIGLEENAGSLVFDLPAEIAEKPGLQGSLAWSRPADAKLDFTVPLDEIKDGSLSTDKTRLKPGYWKYALEWWHASGHYLIEDTVTVH